MGDEKQAVILSSAPFDHPRLNSLMGLEGSENCEGSNSAPTFRHVLNLSLDDKTCQEYDYEKLLEDVVSFTHLLPNLIYNSFSIIIMIFL